MNIPFLVKIISNRKLFFNLSFVLLLFVTTLLILNFLIQFIAVRNRILTIPFKYQDEALFPVIKLNFVPRISAKGAIIMDAQSKVVLYEKNPTLRFSTASTAKIMTALTASDYFKQNDILTVIDATAEGSVLGLRKGQQFTFESLMFAMLLPSANDAALTISQNYPGGESAFINKMNEKASNLKLDNTHYSDSAGLEDSGDFTTPFDLARLAAFAVSNPEIKKVVGTKKTTIYDLSGNSYALANLNKLLGVNGVNGVKTGFTEEAGQVLVTSKLEKGRTIIIVVMGSEDRFDDTSKLVELVANNLIYLSIHP